MCVNTGICDVAAVFVSTGKVRISDLGLAVELDENQTKTKGYAGTPGTGENIRMPVVPFECPFI